MATSPRIHCRQWGDGPPVLALHGLGLDSSAYTGFAQRVVGMGRQMIAADLPGFGLSPAPDIPLSPAVLAEPVIELAGQLGEKPLVMGMSLGARVALEAVLQAPELFRGAVLMAPPLPRREHRWALVATRLISPWVAERLPIERAWPYLKRKADELEDELTGEARHDWFLRASKRTIYNISCPATRRAFISAAKELTLEPAFGPNGVWTRLEQLRLPTAFIWGDQDKIIGQKSIPFVEQAVPGAFQLHVPCAGHFDNGPHFRCMDAAAVDAIQLVEGLSSRRRSKPQPNRRLESDCVVTDDEARPSHGVGNEHDLAPAV